MSVYKVVGESVIRIDAVEKATGRAKYCTDFKIPGILYAKLLRSPYPHAEIVKIDTSMAENIPGVRAIITGKDVPPVRWGSAFWDEYMLPYDNKVLAIGQPVAAVAADTEELADEALAELEVDYRELPAVFDVEEAMSEKPVAVLHPDVMQYISPMPFLKARPELGMPNVFNHFKIRRGDIDKGFKEADLILENRFETSRIAHCQMETHRCDAWWEADGTLVCRLATQGLWQDAAALRQIFGLSPSKVRMLSSYEGGGFGGNVGTITAPIAALLARRSGKPVRLVYSREEQFSDGRQRPRFIVYVKDGFKNDGMIVARQARIIIDAGRHSGTTALLSKNSAFGAVGTYSIPHFKLDCYGVYTNNPITGPYRGFGTTELTWAIEQQMDMAAEKLGISASDIRKKNFLKEGEPDVCGQITHSIGIEGCLDKVLETVPLDKKSADKGPWKKGRGVAIGNKYTLAGTHSVVFVKVFPDAHIELRHGLHEIGQGLNTVLAQIAAEEFQVPVDWIKITHGDTAIVPNDLLVASSRSTFHAGNAAIRACRDAKRQLFELASTKLGVSIHNLAMKDGEIYALNWPGNKVNISDLFIPVGIVAGTGEIMGRGHYHSPIIMEDPETGHSERMVSYYAHGACSVEVAVNVETGIIKVEKIAQSYDAGNPINPKMVEGQIEGGTLQGIGSALYEEIITDKGKVLNPTFTDYRVPVTFNALIGDQLNCSLCNAPHREGPYNAKGVGEMTMIPVAPAISNAVYDAIGVRIDIMPITPEKVLKALNESKK